MLVLMTVKMTKTWMLKNEYLYRWLLPFNGLQDGKPYDRRLVDNSPKFIPLYNRFNRDILHPLRVH